MDLVALLVCDAATVREGLLHVLGGGITRLWRQELPAQFSVTVVACVQLESDELDIPHEFNLTVKGPHGKLLVDAMGGFQSTRPARMEPGERLLVPVIVPMPPQAGTDAFGKHTASLDIDKDVLSRSLEFWVLSMDELALPPL